MFVSWGWNKEKYDFSKIISVRNLEFFTSLTIFLEEGEYTFSKFELILISARGNQDPPYIVDIYSEAHKTKLSG